MGVAEGWHKCFICDTLYHEPEETGYWATCRPFVEGETQEAIKKQITNLKKKEK